MDLQFLKAIILEEHTEEVVSFDWDVLDLLSLPWESMVFTAIYITKGSTILTFQILFKERPRNQSDLNAYRLSW